MGTKNKTTTQNNSTTTAAPPSWTPPGLTSLAGAVTAAIPQVQGIPAYTGDFVAQPGVISQQVPQAYLDAAQLARSMVTPAQQAVQASGIMPSFSGPDLASTYQSFASTNPGGMEGAVLAATNPIMRQLTESVLPSLQSAGIESGAYGSTRMMETLPNMAIRDSMREMSDVAAGLTYQDFLQQRNRAQQAYAMATQRGLGEADVLTQRLGLTPDLLDTVMRLGGGSAELMAAGGAADMANRQAAIDNALQQYQYQVNRPFMGLDVATQLLAQLGQGYGTTTTNGTQTVTQKTGGLAPILGGLMGAGMAVAGLPMAGGGSLGGSLVSQLFGRRSTGG